MILWNFTNIFNNIFLNSGLLLKRKIFNHCLTPPERLYWPPVTSHLIDPVIIRLDQRCSKSLLFKFSCRVRAKTAVLTMRPARSQLSPSADIYNIFSIFITALSGVRESACPICQTFLLEAPNSPVHRSRTQLKPAICVKFIMPRPNRHVLRARQASPVSPFVVQCGRYEVSGPFCYCSYDLFPSSHRSWSATVPTAHGE